MNPPPAPSDPAAIPPPVLPPAARRPTRRVMALVAVAAAVLVVAAAVVAAGRGGRSPGAVSVTARLVNTVDLQVAPGQLTIVSAPVSQVRLTGDLRWTGHIPLAAMRVDHVARILHLSYRCAAASPCTENFRLVIPPRTAVILHQPSGHVIMAGLAGPLRITARSVNVSGTGLRCPSLAAAITSGHLSATFEAAPRRVSLTLISAQATLRLPASVGYAISSQVTSGYVHVGIPQASSAPRTVTDRIVSGELELLPVAGTR
jgi:hypothetical protein